MDPFVVGVLYGLLTLSTYTALIQLTDFPQLEDHLIAWFVAVFWPVVWIIAITKKIVL